MADMRKTILLMLLAIVSGSAMAEWIQVSETDTNTVYADPATIHMAARTVKMWSLYDFKAVQSIDGLKPYLSSKQQYEYDCKEMKSRRRASSQHSKNMGGGKVVYSDTYTSKWKPVPPDSGLEILWKFACLKK